MAFRFAVGSKVQALDETGHWESAKVLRVFQDAALVRFDGYKAVDDRVVPRVDIRSPEAYHKTGECFRHHYQSLIEGYFISDSDDVDRRRQFGPMLTNVDSFRFSG